MAGGIGITLDHPAASYVPVVGPTRDAIQAASGQTFMSGPLSPAERQAALTSAAMNVVPFGIAAKAGSALKIGVKSLHGGPTSEVADIATKGTLFRNWNEFQAGTAGQFANRVEAGAAWVAYKEAQGIATGVNRSTVARSEFLTGMAESGKAPSWMNQWLQQGKVPPGHHVDHIKPLSIGGSDTPANMRLLDIDMHRTHHRYYRPWE